MKALLIVGKEKREFIFIECNTYTNPYRLYRVYLIRGKTKRSSRHQQRLIYLRQNKILRTYTDKYN